MAIIMKTRLRLISIVTLLFLLVADGVLSAQTVIHAGKLINGHDGQVHNEMTIVVEDGKVKSIEDGYVCLLYTSPSPRDRQKSRMPSSA